MILKYFQIIFGLGALFHQLVCLKYFKSNSTLNQKLLDHSLINFNKALIFSTNFCEILQEWFQLKLQELIYEIIIWVSFRHRFLLFTTVDYQQQDLYFPVTIKFESIILIHHYLNPFILFLQWFTQFSIKLVSLSLCL